MGALVSHGASALLLAATLLLAIIPARVADAVAAWLGRRVYAWGGRRTRQLRANLLVVMGASATAQEVNGRGR